MLKIGQYLTKNGSEADVIRQIDGKFIGHVRYVGIVTWNDDGTRTNKDPNPGIYDAGDDLDINLDTFQEKQKGQS